MRWERTRWVFISSVVRQRTLGGCVDPHCKRKRVRRLRLLKNLTAKWALVVRIGDDSLRNAHVRDPSCAGPSQVHQQLRVLRTCGVGPSAALPMRRHAFRDCAELRMLSDLLSCHLPFLRRLMQTPHGAVSNGLFCVVWCWSLSVPGCSSSREMS